eukprot:12103251-Ditylum_brightwellii.AAC.1
MQQVLYRGSELITKGEDGTTTTKAARTPNKTHYKVNKNQVENLCKTGKNHQVGALLLNDTP